MCKSISEEGTAPKIAHMLEEFIYFLLKNSIKQRQKSDWNKYEIVYEIYFRSALMLRHAWNIKHFCFFSRIEKRVTTENLWNGEFYGTFSSIHISKYIHFSCDISQRNLRIFRYQCMISIAFYNTIKNQYIYRLRVCPTYNLYRHQSLFKLIIFPFSYRKQKFFFIAAHIKHIDMEITGHLIALDGFYIHIWMKRDNFSHNKYKYGEHYS